MVFISGTAIAKFDIISFAKEILREVDSIRSRSMKTESDVIEESRLNAFFRLIGLPMFVNISKNEGEETEAKTGDRVLSPGFYGNKFDGCTISNNMSFGSGETLYSRENVLAKIESDIGTREMNARMTYAMYYPLNLVPNYPEDNRETAKEGMFEVVTGQGRKAFKMLFPLATSCPIYGSVWPRENDLAQPFAPKEKSTFGQTSLRRAFIETVIRMRLITGENSGNSESQAKVDQIFAGIQSLVPEENLNNLTQEYKSLSSGSFFDVFIYNKLFSAIEQLAKQWVNLDRQKYRCLDDGVMVISARTASSQANPFGKRTVMSQDLELVGKTNPKILELQNQIAKEQAILGLLPFDDESGLGNKNATPTALTNSFVSLLSYNLEQLEKERRAMDEQTKKSVQQRDGLRLELEVTTGEFTGLSIPDVIAVIIGLFMIDKEKLLALLDEDALNNMKTDTTLKSAYEKYGKSAGTVDAALEAINQLESAVSSVYKLLDTAISATKNKMQRTKSGKAQKKQAPETTDVSTSDTVKQGAEGQ